MLFALHKNMAFHSLFFLFFVHSLSNLLIEFVKLEINFSYLFIAWLYDFLKSIKKCLISFWISKFILEVKRVILLAFRCVEYVLFARFTLSNFKSHAVLIIYVNICLLTVLIKYFNFFYPYLLIFWVYCS